jgi:hypothetical protein
MRYYWYFIIYWIESFQIDLNRMASEVIACDENSQATYDNQVFLHLVFF